MDLKDFIKGTISSISEAIQESQEELGNKGLLINPEKMAIDNDGKRALKSDGVRYVQNLNFDVLLAVEDKQGDNLNGGIKVAGVFNIGGGINDENINKNHNRIKFTIPVAFSTVPTPEGYGQSKYNVH